MATTIKPIWDCEFENKEYKSTWVQFVPRTKHPYKLGTVVQNYDNSGYTIYDGAGNVMAFLDRDHGIRYNGNKTEYKESFVKYALEAMKKAGK